MNKDKAGILLLQNGVIPVKITGISMSPTLKKGDSCYCCKKGSYEIGDIVLFETNGQLMVHRVIKINRNGYYVTKGDNWFHADSPSSPENIVAALVVNEKDKIEMARISKIESVLCCFLPDTLKLLVKRWKQRKMLGVSQA